MTGKPSIDVRDKIRGPRGSVVKITVERAADKRVQTVEITRDAVPQPSIPDSLLDQTRCGIHRHDSRDLITRPPMSFRERLNGLRARGMNSLVLDLRNNPGGFLDQAIHVAEVFLPSGPIDTDAKGTKRSPRQHLQIAK